MKTKVISTILLFLLLCATSSARACICPDEVKRTASAISAVVLQATSSDLCTDCGHTRSCCSSHQELAMAGGATFELPEVLQLAIFIEYFAPFLHKQTLNEHKRLRAPPPVVAERLTPFTAKQVLLI